jgi:hypothetical protein
MTSKEDESFQMDLHFSDFCRNKELKLLELRYQVAIIIIPTVIGLWGFLGLIVTSEIMKNQPFTVYLLIYGGLIVTIFLIFIWRKWVHDMFEEELKLGEGELKIELKHSESCSIVRTVIDNIFNEKVKKIDSDFYEYLIERSDKYEFYKDLKLKLSSSGFNRIDRLSQIVIGILWGIGIILPLLLYILVFRNYWIFLKIFQNWIFVLMISIVAIFVLWQMQVLIDGITLSEKDLHESKLFRYFESEKMKKK